MSDAVSFARGIVSMQAASTQQVLSVEMLRQNAQAERSVIVMLEQGIEQAKAALPAGQGGLVDRTA